MDVPSISADDLTDVMELTERLEDVIYELLRDHQGSIGVSALMSASINSIIAQCSTLEELHFVREVFVQMMDSTISGVRIKNKDKEKDDE